MTTNLREAARAWSGHTGRRCLVLHGTFCLVAVLVLSTLIGCSQATVAPLTPPQPPIVWPSPPDQARVRYLGSLRGSTDVPPRKSLRDSFDELLHGPKAPALFVTPQAVAVHKAGSKVAVADTGGACVHILDLDGRKYERISSIGRPPRTFECPVGVAWAEDALWVADAKLHELAVVEGANSRWVGGDLLKRPAGLAYCLDNALCYVCDSAAHAILAFNAHGKMVLQFGSHGTAPGQFNVPSHIACGPGPSLAVADSLNFRVQRLAPDGTPLGAFGEKGDAAGDFALPKGVAFDPQGNIWVVDAQFENVQAFTAEGRLLLTIGREGRNAGEFYLPAGMCIDGKGRIWIADAHNRRVQVFELLP